MKDSPTMLKGVDILGNGQCSSDREIFTAILKRWRRTLGYCSIFAAVPAILSAHTSEARSDEAKKPESAVSTRSAKLFERLNLRSSTRALLKRQSQFLLPHQKGNFSMVAALAGNDNCPGRSIPGGSYTAAAPFTDSGDTTGANNTFTRLEFYYESGTDARGPDHAYSFTLTGLGPNPRIEVSTSSGTYRPLIYVLYGGYAGACPSGTSNVAFPLLSSGALPGGTAIISSQLMSSIPLNIPVHLFIDSEHDDASGSGPYTIRMQDVTIAAAACPNNPIDCPEFFITEHYYDFLFRQPDPAGFAAWLSLLKNCAPGDTSCDRTHVSGAFFQSPEFQGRGYFIYRFYPVAFGRKPDWNEFIQDFWGVSGFHSDAQLEARKLLFIENFMSRPAFVTKFNGLTNAQYVDTLLSTAGVAPHQFRDFWIAALGNGTRTRAQVLREISESPEVYNKYYNQAFVVMQYFGYLRRDPDALYLNWISHLDATGDSRSMINGFINSIEYRARFGP